jgi:hypothetical protein
LDRKRCCCCDLIENPRFRGDLVGDVNYVCARIVVVAAVLRYDRQTARCMPLCDLSSELRNAWIQFEGRDERPLRTLVEKKRSGRKCSTANYDDTTVVPKSHKPRRIKKPAERAFAKIA